MTFFVVLLFALTGSALQAVNCLSSLVGPPNIPHREVSLAIQEANLPAHVQQIKAWAERGIISVAPLEDAPNLDTLVGTVYQRSRYELLSIRVSGYSFSPKPFIY